MRNVFRARWWQNRLNHRKTDAAGLLWCRPNIAMTDDSKQPDAQDANEGPAASGDDRDHNSETASSDKPEAATAAESPRESDTESAAEADSDADSEPHTESDSQSAAESESQPNAAGWRGAVSRGLDHPAAFAITLSIIALILLLRISSFGIWDPWELNAADTARNLLEGQSPEGDTPISAAARLVAWSFGALGISELAGRLPLVIAGLLAVVVAWWIATRFGDRRAGIIAMVVAGTSPLFLFNARQMLGASLSFAAAGLVGVLAMKSPPLIHRRTSTSWRVSVPRSSAQSSSASGPAAHCSPCCHRLAQLPEYFC